MRRLKKNEGTTIPARHVFFDTETLSDKVSLDTKIETLQFRLACAKYVRLTKDGIETEKKEYFFDPESLWQWIDQFQNSREPLWVWAHNLGFDLTISKFWEELERGRYDCGVVKSNGNDSRFQGSKDFKGQIVVSGRPTFIKAIGNRGRLLFTDLGNYCPASLDSIGNTLGIPKTKWPGNEADDETLIEYCFNDVDILSHAAISLMNKWRELNLGIWQVTAAKLAFTSWRHFELGTQPDGKEVSVITNREDEPDRFEREGYFGGRVECYYLGFKREPVYHLDIQSCYPGVMKNGLFPTYRKSYYRMANLDLLQTYIGSGSAMARVYIESEQAEYPVRIQGRLCFCRGKFWTTLCGPELLRAYKAGAIKDIRELAIYDLDRIFSRWVDKFWRLKQSAIERGNCLDLEFANMILRSLSGKFAQGGWQWIDSPDVASPQDWGQWSIDNYADNTKRHFRAIAGHTQEYVYSEPPDWGFPAISAWITSYGRERLRDLVRICPVKSVVHVATDSLHVTEDGFNALLNACEIQQDTLGKLKIIDSCFTSEWNGPNDYNTDDRIVRSGSWGAASENEKGEWWFNQWERLPQIISRRPDGTVKVKSIQVEYTQRKDKLEYDKEGWGLPWIIHQEKLDCQHLTQYQDRWTALPPLPASR